MLRLIIADDERVIRETISHLIDWKQLDIELIGLCQDGIEAYNMILDESPDIVMTDIRMPGLSGLELVREIQAADLPVQFIILSGYEEFEYAREAMKYGIKQYLLKPCKEAQIRESILQTVQDVQQMKAMAAEKEQTNEMLGKIRQDAMYHLIAEGIVLNQGATKQGLELLVSSYSQYIDFFHETYQLYSLHNLTQECLEDFWYQLRVICSEDGKDMPLYGVLAGGFLFLLGREGTLYQKMEDLCKSKGLDPCVEARNYSCLFTLFEEFLGQLRRFDYIQVIHGEVLLPVANNHNILQWLQKQYELLDHADESESKELCQGIIQMLREIQDLDFMRLLAGSISVHFSAKDALSSAEAAEFMLKVNQEEDIAAIKCRLEELIENAQRALSRSKRGYGELAEAVMDYVKDNIADSNLTLKKIAEQHLFMNVDYVSRQFQKATGIKFSQYLAEQRVRTAKKLLLEENGKVQYVAEQVGCGTNSQYFSQVFKKVTGVTPSKWLQQMQNNKNTDH